MAEDDRTIRTVHVAENIAVPTAAAGRGQGSYFATVDVLVTTWSDGSVDVALRHGPGAFGVRTWGPRTVADRRQQ